MINTKAQCSLVDLGRDSNERLILAVATSMVISACKENENKVLIEYGTLFKDAVTNNNIAHTLGQK